MQRRKFAKPELAYGPAAGGQTVQNLRRLAYKFELDQSQRKWVAKRNARAENLRVRVARALWMLP